VTEIVDKEFQEEIFQTCFAEVNFVKFVQSLLEKVNCEFSSKAFDKTINFSKAFKTNKKLKLCKLF
jgi:hypothetical protein